MADTPEAPDWDLLPHNPERFFNLAEGFDRRDLKRAYNRLLRQFKPEKFPQEFQRIRAAFEELDEQIRYGAAKQQNVIIPDDWLTDDPFVETPPEKKSAEPDPFSLEETPAEEHPVPYADRQTESEQTEPQTGRPKRLIDRVATESPADLLAELEAKAEKTPYEYYALALLADVVEESNLGFAKWIIKGIGQHRHDGALKQLLHDYFRGPQTGEGLLQLLPLAAKAVRTDEFYPITEPAWQVLLRECDYQQFVDTYNECEAQLRGTHIIGRMAFLIQMLKSAVWHDPQRDGWAAQQLRFVDENFESIPPWLEMDVEMLALVQDYLDVREQFARGSSLRSKLDAALKDYFSEPQEEGDRSIVAVQMEILSRSEELMDEFPLSEVEIFQKFYPIWSWASLDVAERQSIESEHEYDRELWAGRASALLERLSKECKGSRIGWLWSAAFFGRYALLIFIGFVVLLLTMSIGMAIPFLLHENEVITFEQAENSQGSIFAISIVSAVTIPWWWLKSKIDRKLWFPLDGKFAAKCYEQSWRRELMDFQRRSHVPDVFFRRIFHHFADNSTTATWINNFVQDDFAPALLAGAQKYEA